MNSSAGASHLTCSLCDDQIQTDQSRALPVWDIQRRVQRDQDNCQYASSTHQHSGHQLHLFLSIIVVSIDSTDWEKITASFFTAPCGWCCSDFCASCLPCLENVNCEGILVFSVFTMTRPAIWQIMAGNTPDYLDVKLSPCLMFDMDYYTSLSL